MSSNDFYLPPSLDDAVRDGEEQSRGRQLRERVFEFVVRVAQQCDHLGDTRSTTDIEIAGQLFRSVASIGANLEEADAAQSRADFISKCSISLKEAREARYWLRLVARRHPENDLNLLLDEIKELIAILTTIVRKSRENS